VLSSPPVRGTISRITRPGNARLTISSIRIRPP
jgi:hypothetical protein